MNYSKFFEEFKRGKRKENILDSILISDVTDDSIIVSINKKFIKIFKFYDMNFELQDMHKKREILNQYKRILNVLSVNVGLSIIIRNKRVELAERVLFDTSDGRFVDLKNAANETIIKNVDKDNRTYVLEKYFIFEINAINIEKARKDFEMIEHVFNAEIETLEGAKLRELDRDEIYKFIALFYNRNEIENIKNYHKNMSEDLREKLGISVPEFIKPTNIIERDNEIIVSDRIYRSFYFYKNYKLVDIKALDNIMNNEFEVICCIKIRKLLLQDAIRQVELELGNADGEIYRIETELTKQGLSKDLLPRNAVQRKEEATYINDSLKKRDENLFDVSMFFLIGSNDIIELNENSQKLMSNAALNGLNIQAGFKMQENIFNSIMPNGVNETPYIRTLDTESLCALNIFKASDCIMKDGEYFGVNKLTGNPIVYDIMSGDNFSSLIFGMAGKGKGFKAKETTLYRILNNRDRSTIIIDPEDEYGDLVEELGGVNIEITSGGKSHINLFDIDLSYGDNSISDKEDFILSLCSSMLHKPITSGQRTTISEAVSQIYEKWSISNNSNDIPTIEDFSKALKNIVDKTKSREDREIYKAIEYYSEKSHCTLFRGKSNIDFSNRLINFNLNKLGKDLRVLAMEVICDTIWLKICQNRKLLIPTDVLIDEFHLMFREEETSAWMSKYWKQLRKYKGCPVGITQNPEDVLSSEDGRKVIANTTMNILLSMQEKDRKMIKEVLNLTDEELKYIRNKKAGEGLLVIGSGKKITNQIAIPFINKYDKDNKIYALINTSYDAEIKDDVENKNDNKENN